MTQCIKLLLLICLSSCSKNKVREKEWTQSDGYVPDSVTAIKVADIIITRIYGDRTNKRHFSTTETDSTWIIKGTLNPDEDGGVPTIEIRKSDCKIIFLRHTK